MEFMISYILLCGMVSWYASLKELGGVRFFIISLLISPIVGVIISFFMSEKE
jgi:phosphate/sulfate permease